MSKPITESILSNETRVFLMCCDFRSFSAVAHALGITQSAVSKIIRKFRIPSALNCSSATPGR